MVISLRVGPDGSWRNKKVLPANTRLDRFGFLAETDFIESGIACLLRRAGLPLLLALSLRLHTKASVVHLVRGKEFLPWFFISLYCLLKAHEFLLTISRSLPWIVVGRQELEVDALPGGRNLDEALLGGGVFVNVIVGQLEQALVLAAMPLYVFS